MSESAPDPNDVGGVDAPGFRTSEAMGKGLAANRDGEGSARHPSAWVVPGVFALVVTAYLAASASSRAPWAVGAPGAAGEWWQPTPGNGWFAAVFAALWAVTLYSYWRPRRRRPMALALLVVGGLAVLAAILGFSAYVPCTGAQVPGLAATAWTVLLFVGSTETGSIGLEAVGTSCQTVFPLAFQLARFLAIAATFVGAGAAVFAVSRQQLDKLIVKFAGEVDVVAGLDETTIPLIKALVEERRRMPRRPTWYEPNWRERIRRPRRSRVVLIHNNAKEPLLGEVRSIGALVLDADPTKPDSLRPALVLRNRVSLRRLFAVSSDQQVNVDVWEAAVSVLTSGDSVRNGKGTVPAVFVPRVVVRFDDPREARDWRLAHVDAGSWFNDALTVDDLLARGIVERVLRAKVTRVVIAGDSPLANALLDEFAWRRICGHDLAVADPSKAPGWTVPSIVLAGDRADRVEAEWESHRAPTPAGLLPLNVESRVGDWESLAGGIVGAGRSAAVVVVAPPTPDVLTRATRLARTHDCMVIAPDLAMSGVARERNVGGTPAVVRYGPTLLQGDGVPEDSWTALARQQHEWFLCRYRGESGDERATSREWGEPGESEDHRLPEFIREDNLQQYRKVLTAVAARGWGWEVVRPGDGLTAMPASMVEAVAREEHARWLELRRRTGWQAPGPEHALLSPQELEEKRLNRNVRELDDALLPQNLEQIRGIIARLFTWGVRAVPRDPAVLGGAYRRRGEVRARRLGEPVEWQTASGETLRGNKDDWWVEGPDGAIRTVAEVEFPRLYEQVDGDRYRRVGTVRARRATVEEVIDTLEGRATAEQGMWVVTDDSGNSWPVPDHVFGAGYEPALA